MYNRKVIIDAIRNLNKSKKQPKYNKDYTNNSSTQKKKDNVITGENGVNAPVYKSIQIGPSKIHGKGVFSQEPIAKGDVIGVSHIRKNFTKNGQQYQAPFPSTQLGGYYNHSESPNIQEVDNKDHILLLAKRNINPGEELTSNYYNHNIDDLETPDKFKKGGSSKRPQIPSKKNSKAYSRSFEATNKFFAQNPLFKKSKSRKNKIFDPNAKYYADGGENLQEECPPYHYWNGETCVPVSRELAPLDPQYLSENPDVATNMQIEPEVSVSPLGSDFSKAKSWINKWHDSPMHDEMLMKSLHGNKKLFKEYKDKRKKNIQTIPALNISLDKSDPLYKEIKDYYGFAPWGASDSNTGAVSIYNSHPGNKQMLIHEVTHSSDRPDDKLGRLIPPNDQLTMQYRTPLNWKNSQYGKDIMKEYKEKGWRLDDEYMGEEEIPRDIYEQQQFNDWNKYLLSDQGTEVRARLSEIRQDAQEQNIYDPFNKKITRRQFKNLKNIKYPDSLDDLRKTFSDKDIRWMLNNISKNNNETEDAIQYSKKGGAKTKDLPKASYGLTGMGKYPAVTATPFDFRSAYGQSGDFNVNPNYSVSYTTPRLFKKAELAGNPLSFTLGRPYNTDAESLTNRTLNFRPQEGLFSSYYDPATQGASNPQYQQYLQDVSDTTGTPVSELNQTVINQYNAAKNLAGAKPLYKKGIPLTANIGWDAYGTAFGDRSSGPFTGYGSLNAGYAPEPGFYGTADLGIMGVFGKRKNNASIKPQAYFNKGLTKQGDRAFIPKLNILNFAVRQRPEYNDIQTQQALDLYQKDIEQGTTTAAEFLRDKTDEKRFDLSFISPEATFQIKPFKNIPGVASITGGLRLDYGGKDTSGDRIPITPKPYGNVRYTVPLDVELPKNKIAHLFDKGVVDRDGHVRIPKKTYNDYAYNQDYDEEYTDEYTGDTPEEETPTENNFEVNPPQIQLNPNGTVIGRGDCPEGYERPCEKCRCQKIKMPQMYMDKRGTQLFGNEPIRFDNGGEQDAMNAMMKARLAYANMFGNPAAQRMINIPDQPYEFDNGDTGTHYMASMDNYAVPQIQNVNGQLVLGDYGPESAEAFKFDSDEDANYFAEHYKDVSPGFMDMELTQKEIDKYVKGGYIVEDISVPSLTRMDNGGYKGEVLKRKRKRKKQETEPVEPLNILQPGEELFPLPTSEERELYYEPISLKEMSPEELEVYKAEEQERLKYESDKAAQPGYFDEAMQWVKDWHNSPMYNQMVLKSNSGQQKKADDLTKLRKKNIETIPPLVVAEKRYEIPAGSEEFDSIAAATSNDDTGEIEIYPGGFADGPSTFVHEILHGSDRPRDLYSWDYPAYKTGLPIDYYNKKGIDLGYWVTEMENDNVIDVPDWMLYEDPRFDDEGLIWHNRIMPKKDQMYITTHRGSNWKDNERYKKENAKGLYTIKTDKDIENELSDYKNDPNYKEIFKATKELPYEIIEGRKKYWKNNVHNYISVPTEVRARLGEIRYNAQKEGIYDPFTEQITPEIFQNYINKERDIHNIQPMGPIDDLREEYTDEEILWMLQNISKNKSQEDESNIVQYGKMGGELPKARFGRITKEKKVSKEPVKVDPVQDMITKISGENLGQLMDKENYDVINTLKDKEIISQTLNPMTLMTYPNLLDLATRRGIQDALTFMRSTEAKDHGISTSGTKTDLAPRDLDAIVKYDLENDKVGQALYAATHIPNTRYGRRSGLSSLPYETEYVNIFRYGEGPTDYVVANDQMTAAERVKLKTGKDPSYLKQDYLKQGTPDSLDALYTYANRNTPYVKAVKKGNFHDLYGPYKSIVRYPFDYSGSASNMLQRFVDLENYTSDNSKTETSRKEGAKSGDIVTDSLIDKNSRGTFYSMQGPETAVIGNPGQKVFDPVATYYKPGHLELEAEKENVYNLLENSTDEEIIDYVNDKIKKGEFSDPQTNINLLKEDPEFAKIKSSDEYGPGVYINYWVDPKTGLVNKNMDKKDAARAAAQRYLDYLEWIKEPMIMKNTSDVIKIPYSPFRFKFEDGGEYQLGDEVDEATMQKLKEGGYTFEIVK